MLLLLFFFYQKAFLTVVRLNKPEISKAVLVDEFILRRLVVSTKSFVAMTGIEEYDRKK
jgi:hypothetical protein